MYRALYNACAGIYIYFGRRIENKTKENKKKKKPTIEKGHCFCRSCFVSGVISSEMEGLEAPRIYDAEPITNLLSWPRAPVGPSCIFISLLSFSFSSAQEHAHVAFSFYFPSIFIFIYLFFSFHFPHSLFLFSLSLFFI